MRRANEWILLIGLGAGALARAGAETLDPAGAIAVEQQGNALAQALLREDFATVAATACSPVLARTGGALALARQIEVSFKVMKQQGRQLLQMQFDPASAVFDSVKCWGTSIPNGEKIAL